MFIVWTESRDGIVSATIKHNKRAAVTAYNRINGAEFLQYGWSIANDADPVVRVAAGLSEFPK